jgi:16S rRNA (guanine1207-N2)-methyltransferase
VAPPADERELDDGDRAPQTAAGGGARDRRAGLGVSGRVAGGEQYFSRRPASRSERRTVAVVLPDVQLDLVTDRGVFAGARLDPGTETLLRRGELVVPDGPVLDLGCGYGPIALTLARRNPAAVIWAVDVNERARDLCRENVRATGVANVAVAAPEEVPADLRFAGLWSNPPIRIGKGPLHELLLHWLRRLDARAAGHLVVHKHLGSDSLARWLGEQGWRATRRASHDGYRLLDVTAAATPAPGV